MQRHSHSLAWFVWFKPILQETSGNHDLFGMLRCLSWWSFPDPQMRPPSASALVAASCASKFYALHGQACHVGVPGIARVFLFFFKVLFHVTSGLTIPPTENPIIKHCQTWAKVDGEQITNLLRMIPTKTFYLTYILTFCLPSLLAFFLGKTFW